MINRDSVVSTAPVTPKKANWLLSFTGLIPVILAIPIILLHQWTISIVVTIVSALIVIGYHLRKGQGISSLDVLSLLFGLVNAVLYFGFGSTIVLQHLDLVIYTLLLLQVVYSLLRNDPWTIQYAKRTVAPELWETAAFRRSNRSLTIVWGGVFLACDLIALLVSDGLLHTLLPVALLVMLAVLTPRLGKVFGRVQ